VKRWKKTLISFAAILAVLIVAYFGTGFVIYDTLGNVKGSCDEHIANGPDVFALHET
jgi:hypothetical protein